MNSVLLFLILLAIVCPACLMGAGEGLTALVLLLLFVVPAILVLYVFPGFLFIVIPVAVLWIWIARSEPKPEGADDRAAALHQLRAPRYEIAKAAQAERTWRQVISGLSVVFLYLAAAPAAVFILHLLGYPVLR
jgi:hypothetical protein